MILAGDDCRRTQHGNNNPYLQDNELSAFQLPHVIGRSWYRALDTALAAPVWSTPGTEAPISAHDYVARARSVVVLVSKP